VSSDPFGHLLISGPGAEPPPAISARNESCRAGRGSANGFRACGPCRLQRGQPVFQRTHIAGLLLQLIQQHGSKELILNGQYFAVFVVRHHLGIDLGDFFGDEAILQLAESVVVFRLVKEVHRTQLEQLTAAVSHVRDLLLEAAGGVHSAELPAAVHVNFQTANGRGCVDSRDECAARLGALRSDLNDTGGVAGRAIAAYVDAVAIGNRGVLRRITTDGDVVGPDGVARERLVADGRVVAPGGVIVQCVEAAGGIVVPGGVRKQRPGTAGSVVPPRGVAIQCPVTAGGVVDAGGVVKQCIDAAGRVLAAGRITLQGAVAHGRVGLP